MKKQLCLFGVLTLGAASAASTEYGTVLRGWAGPQNVKLSRNVAGGPVYEVNLSLGGAKSYRVQLDDPAPGYLEIALSGETQSPAQKQAVGNLAAQLAIRCFNLLPARQAAITTWVSSQLNLRERSEQAFGPVTITLDQTTREPSVIVARSTPKPGQAPWLTYCGTIRK